MKHSFNYMTISRLCRSPLRGREIELADASSWSKLGKHIFLRRTTFHSPHTYSQDKYELRIPPTGQSRITSDELLEELPF